MNAYAELVTGFIGLVHEIQRERLKRGRKRLHPSHQCSFLFLSVYLLRTARGILAALERRKLDVAIYHLENPLPLEDAPSDSIRCIRAVGAPMTRRLLDRPASINPKRDHRLTWRDRPRHRFRTWDHET
jgi:hypothetical protein